MGIWSSGFRVRGFRVQGCSLNVPRGHAARATSNPKPSTLRAMRESDVRFDGVGFGIAVEARL